MKPLRAFAGSAAALAVACSLLQAPAALADSNPYQRGPDPTTASITAENGPFAVSQASIPLGSGSGFNNSGTIYYPTDTSQGKFGALTIMPGFLGFQWMIQWLGPRLASQGFVVMTMDTVTPIDPPIARQAEMDAALKYLTTQSAVKDRIDPHRLGVVGWSMAGGGALEEGVANPDVKGVVAYSPWDLLGSEDTKLATPTLFFGGDLDVIAPTPLFAQPWYNADKTDDKALIQLKNATHFQYMIPTTVISEYTMVWLKRFLDQDHRYDQFLCPGPGSTNDIAQYTIKCPLP